MNDISAPATPSFRTTLMGGDKLDSPPGGRDDEPVTNCNKSNKDNKSQLQMRSVQQIGVSPGEVNYFDNVQMQNIES